MRAYLALTVAALAAFSTACASSGAVPKPFPMPGGTAHATRPASPVGPATAPSDNAAAASPAGTTPPAAEVVSAPFTTLVADALKLQGAKYKNGGADPTGFDCSGFTQYVFAQVGLALPRAVRDQFKVGEPIDPSGDFVPGDLLFFTTTEPGASHVAIWVGGDQFVHAPSSKGVVRVEKLTVKYWTDRFLGARRLTQP